LRESPIGGADIAVAEIEWSSEEGPGAWSLFCFDAVADSRGKRFYFFIEIMGDSPIESLHISGSKLPGDPELSFFINHIAAQGSLSFKVYSMKQFRYAAS
jgi:hypothetical protein